MPGYFIRCSICGRDGHNKLTCGRTSTRQRYLERKWKRESTAARRARYRAQGLCFYCGLPPRVGLKTCLDCAMNVTAAQRAYKQRRKQGE
jgi:hypothetical protein